MEAYQDMSEALHATDHPGQVVIDGVASRLGILDYSIIVLSTKKTRANAVLISTVYITSLYVDRVWMAFLNIKYN